MCDLKHQNVDLKVSRGYDSLNVECLYNCCKTEICSNGINHDEVSLILKDDYYPFDQDSI